VEARVQALLATIDEVSVKFQLIGVSKEIQSLELEKGYGFDSIANEYLGHCQEDLCFI
jgi:hypothetical protein